MSSCLYFLSPFFFGSYSSTSPTLGKVGAEMAPCKRPFRLAAALLIIAAGTIIFVYGKFAAGVYTSASSERSLDLKLGSSELPLTHSAPTAASAHRSQEASAMLPSHELRTMLPCAVEVYEANFLRSVEMTSELEITTAHGLREQCGVDHVYMIHYQGVPGKNQKSMERRKLMTELLAVHNVSAQWVVGFDREALSAPMIECVTGWHPTNLSRYCPRNDHARDCADNEWFSDRKKQRHFGPNGVPLPSLKPSQRSVVMKHHSAVYDQVRRNYSVAMILEDDAFLRANFRHRLADVMRAVPSGFDVIWIGGCMKMHAYRRKFQTRLISKHIYEKREARCAHAYILSQAGARKLLASFPLTLPIDFQITAAMKEFEMASYWVEPFLSVQGNVGGCVTNDLGAGCVSVSKYDVAFDAKFADTTRVDEMWDAVPSFHSKR